MNETSQILLDIYASVLDDAGEIQAELDRFAWEGDWDRSQDLFASARRAKVLKDKAEVEALLCRYFETITGDEATAFLAAVEALVEASLKKPRLQSHFVLRLATRCLGASLGAEAPAPAKSAAPFLGDGAGTTPCPRYHVVRLAGICPKCQGQKYYSTYAWPEGAVGFDAFFCSGCDEWLEPACTGPNCQYCAARPERPSLVGLELFIEMPDASA